MSSPSGTAQPALSHGLRAAGLWYGGGTVALAWAASAWVATTAGAPARWILLLAVPAAVIAAGGVLFTLPAPRRVSAVVVLGAVVVLLAGFTAALVVVARSPMPPGSTAAYPLSPLKTAMLAFTVNAGRRRAPLLTGAALLVATEAVAATAGPVLGLPWAFDLPEAATLLLIALGSAGFLIAGRRIAQPWRASELAEGAETLTRTRSVARSRAAAVVHDTVLGDLAAVAALGPGPAPAAAVARFTRTLELLAEPDWDAGTTGPVAVGGPVLAAVGRAEAAGLTVRLDGELAALGGLPAEVQHALAAAVEQCLANTRTHAGTDVADMTVLADPAGLTVMVSDAGTGFDPERVDRARLGLTTAVRARIEEVGGTVRVFAQPQVGTTVLLSVPGGAAP
jgi:signal transduction histidine kinase